VSEAEGRLSAPASEGERMPYETQDVVGWFQRLRAKPEPGGWMVHVVLHQVTRLPMCPTESDTRAS
jgi:hypothetical protein